MSTHDPAGRSRLVSRLTSDLPSLAARVVTAVSAQVPAYGALGTEQLEEVDQIARWGVARVLRAWVADERLEPEDLRRFEGIGAARALDGRPLPALLHAYHVAGRVVTDLVVETAGEELTTHDALSLARLWMSTLDEVTRAVATGHARAREHVGDDPSRALALLLEDLLAGRHATPSAVRARAEHLGVPVPQVAGLLLVPAAPATEGTLRGALDALRSDPPSPARPSLGTISSGTTSCGTVPTLSATTTHEGWLVALDPALTTPGAARRLLDHLLLPPEPQDAGGGGEARAGGRPHGRAPGTAACWAATSLDEVSAAFRLLARAAPLAPAHLWEQRPLLDLDDASSLLLTSGATGNQAVRTLAAGLPDRLLGPLEPHPALSATVDAFLATGTAEQAARRLGCHPQTLRHRIGRITDLTGRDLRRTWDRHVLEVATTSRRARQSVR